MPQLLDAMLEGGMAARLTVTNMPGLFFTTYITRAPRALNSKFRTFVQKVE